MSDTPRHLVVVPHTHWDREWYRTHEQFRVRLVRLLDHLLDLLERDPSFRCFSLDGQTIVVDDYLAVRPAARERLEKLARAGRLVVGPWHVLPDEWLVSGEALIRNLRTGLRKAAALGASNPVGYVPDQFGHVGQLPQIFRGFGFEGAALWRGVGAGVAETTFLWEAPDGSRLLTVYMPQGYGNGALLPVDAEGLAERLRREIDALAPFSRIPSLLLMNGSDHLEPQPMLPGALQDALALLPPGTSAEIGTLAGFIRRAQAESRADLPVHRGELRSGLRAPLLPGCASARMPQKRSDFRNDRLLVKYLEPLSAWLAALGGEADPGLLDFIWGIALENHPHDSICGCSVDRVHEQMETRFQRVEELASAELARVGHELVARTAPPPPDDDPLAGDPFVVWNPNPGGVMQVEGEAELEVPGETASAGRALSAHVRAADGRRIPAHVEVIAPGSVWGATFPKRLAQSLLPIFGREVLGWFVNDIGWRIEGNHLRVRVRLGAGAHGPLDVAGTKRALAAALARDEVEMVAIETRRPPRLRLRFVDELPGQGLRVYRIAQGIARRDTRGEGEAPVRALRNADGGVVVENAFWRIDASPDGRIALRRRVNDASVEDALRIVSEGDRGDEYNFDPVPGDPRVERPERVKLGLERSEAACAIVLDARYRVPRALAPDRARRSEKAVALPVTLRVRLAAGLDRVDVEVSLDNTAQDHRLRLHVRAPFAATRFEVESAFEVAERPIAPQPGDFGAARPAEFPVGAVPQRRFASLADAGRALTVANRGNAEVEAVPEADGTTSLALTLLRAVGWLSRGDLSLRPIPAGPPFPTPGAQVPGRHHADFSLRWHGSDDPERAAAAHAFAHPPIVFPGSGIPGAGLADGARLLAVDDPAVVVSAIEPRPDGAVLVRLYEGAGSARRVRIDWLASGTGSFEAVDLAERPDPGVRVESEGSRATLALRPHEIVTLRVRP